MARKTDAYHFEIRTNRNKPIGLLRNSYREDGVETSIITSPTDEQSHFLDLLGVAV